MDETTRCLVDTALSSRYDHLPEQVVHQVRRRIVDTFAGAVGAWDEPVSAMARKVAQRAGGGPAALSTVWGCDWKTTPEAAAFANGTMLRFLDVSDMYRVKSGGHPSDVIAPIIAVAEAMACDGSAVVAAVTLAYDVYCGCCDSIDLNSMGWDQPVYGIVAAAVGVGRLLRLSPEEMGNAIALALAPNMALYQTRRGELSTWKGCAAAYASRNAIFAASLAHDGFSGPTGIFEGECGLFDIVGRFNWLIPDGKTEAHRICGTHMKCFPVCYHGQSPAWASLELRERLGSASPARIHVETYQQAFDAMAGDASRWAPKHRETADHSLPYVVSTALRDGEVSSASFADDRLEDPAMLELMRKVSVEVSPNLSSLYPESAPCRITVETATGACHVAEVRYPRGHVKFALDDQEIDNKFRAMFRRHGSAVQCESALRALWSLDRATDVGAVLRSLVRTGDDAGDLNPVSSRESRRTAERTNA
jgi:2-methylcitrate dehydratase